MKKFIQNCTALLLAGLVFVMPEKAFAQDDPVEWVLRIGGKSADIAGGVHVALEDGVVRLAATMGEAGGMVGDSFETPDAQTAILVIVDPKTGKPSELYAISADDLKSSITGDDVTVNVENDPHLIGTYKGSIGVSQHDLSLLQSPNQSVYLAEFTEKGTISWINTIGSVFETSEATFGGVDSHQEGEVFMTGSYKGTEVLFIHQTGVETANSPTVEDEDAYLIQYGTRGELRDLLLMQGNGNSRGNDVTLAKDGTVAYWGGEYDGIATLGRNVLEAGLRTQDGFLIKLAGDEVEWFIELKGAGDVSVSNVVFNPETGGGYFAGDFGGSALEYELNNVFVKSFDINSSDDGGQYVGAFSAKGEILWIYAISGDATINDLAFREGNPDQKSGVSVAGAYGKAEVYAGPSTKYGFELQGTQDAFLLELDSAGDLMLLPWTTGAAAADMTHDDWIEIVSCFCTGSITRQNVGSATYDAVLKIAGEEVESIGETDVLVFGYNAELSPPLPVELTAFTGLVDGTDAFLSWETASETNNAGFEVQRFGASGWQQVGYVAGAGTTTEAQSYAFTVQGLTPGSHQFRLKQIDFDGTFAFSPTVTVAIQAGQRPQLIDAYPNPFKPRTTIRFSVPEQGVVSVKVYDVMGRLVAELHDGTLPAGIHNIAWDASGMASGVYFYRMQAGAFVESKRMMLLQ
ncbi:MAG: T9SS type A sorting domain-containing protein [Bacteroidota bacterium]